MKARGARPPDADGRVLKRNDGYLPRSGMLRFLAEGAE